MTQVGALRVDFYAGVIALCAVIVFAKFLVHRGRSLPAGAHWRIWHYVTVFSAGLSIAASLAVLGWVDESSGERVIRGAVLGLAVASAIILAIDYWDASGPKGVPAPQGPGREPSRRIVDGAVGLVAALFLSAGGLLVAFGRVEAVADDSAAQVFVPLLAFALAFSGIGALLLQRLARAPRSNGPADLPSVATLRSRAIEASRRAKSAAGAAARSARDDRTRCIEYTEQSGAHSLDCASAILDAEGRGVGSPDSPDQRMDLVKAAQELRGSSAKTIYVASQVRSGTSTLQEAVSRVGATAQQAEEAVRLLNEQL